MKILVNTFKTKLFLFAIILVFTTGCSPTTTLLGPDNGDNDMADPEAEYEANLEDQANMADDGSGDSDNLNDVIDDLNAEYEHERNMADDDGGDSEMDLALDEYGENMADDGGIDYNDLDDELILEEERSGGSCNMIAETSICTDYIGSFWTEAIIRNACSYSGTFSSESCETGSIGGCNVGQGRFSDMIIWMYPYGGSPVPSDTAESAKPSCDINPMGTWVNAR